MAYTPTLWAKGDIVTSEKLNKIEQGIVDKVDKVNGKTLSTNDYTNEDKAKLNGLESQIDHLESLVGSPLVASTAAEMTDEDKVYVYTGSETGYQNGNWYYYNGTTWTSGGVYNSVAFETDDTLSTQGMAADAKKTGDELLDLKEDLSQVSENITKGYVPNYANLLEDWTLESATALDDSTEIIASDDSPSNVIHIQNTSGSLCGASIDLGTLFKPIVAGTYYLHFKARCLRNSAYAYQSPTVNFYQYDGTSLKGSFTQAIDVPVADAEFNDYKEYVKTITLVGNESPFDTFRVYCQTKFDFWIKDIFIVKTPDNNYGYCRNLENPTKTTLKLAVIGDSISDGVRLFPKKWHYYLNKNDGYSINSVAVSGAGYFNGSLAGGTSDHQFYNQALLIDSDADIAIVFGGFNDLGKIVNEDVTIGTKTDTGLNTIGGCINKTIDNILAVNPLIHMAIALPTPWQGMNAMLPSSNEYHDAVFGMINLIEEICAYRGIPCFDLWRYSGLRPWVEAFRSEFYVATNDGTHPNSKGHEQFIYPHMREFLREINWQNI